jgi:hypothetical protein
MSNDTTPFINQAVEEIVNSFPDLDYAIAWMEDNLPSYPEKPNRPKEPNSYATPQEYRDYASALELYANEKEEYDRLNREYRERRMDLETIVQKFIWKNTGLDTVVPEQYRDKVWSLAYDLGHSYGYSEIQNHLIDLVDIFK